MMSVLVGFGCHARFKVVRSWRVCVRNSVETVVVIDDDGVVGSSFGLRYSWTNRRCWQSQIERLLFG